MNKGDLITILRDRHYGPGEAVEMPWSRVAAALDAVLDTVRARLERGERTYWQRVGVFEVITCAARRRNTPRKKGQGGGWHVIQCPAYRRIAYRRSVFLDRVR